MPSLAYPRALVPALLSTAVALLALGAGPARAQSGNAADGKLLYAQALVPGSSATCNACHDVASRRLAITQVNAWESITLDDATGAFDAAIRANAGGFMGSYRGPLNQQQFLDLSAYLADTPRFSGDGSEDDQFDFNVAASGASVAQAITLTHSAAPDADLRVNAVRIEGIGAAAPSGAFTLSTASCPSQTLPASQPCTESVRFAPSGTAVVNELLAFDLQVGSASFTRRVILRGTVGGAPPPPAPAPANAGGGGALGWGWLAALGAAVALAARARRRRA